MSKKRIFIVDDDPKIGELFATVLNRDGHNATSFTSATTVLDEIDDGKVPDVILADLHMPDITGIKLLDELRDRGRSTKHIQDCERLARRAAASDRFCLLERSLAGRPKEGADLAVDRLDAVERRRRQIVRGD